MDKREQVFISSTFLDLREERAAVLQGLLEAECFPAGMELFPAGDSEKWDLIKGVIDDSDYYLLIIGGRYGSIDETDRLSYTEKEYDYAISEKKPVMAFLHGDPGEIPANKTEESEDGRARLNAFRAKVEHDKVVKYWTTPTELPGFVAQALLKLRKNNPAIGWVRGNLAMTPETRTEIAELKAALAEARSEAKNRDDRGPLFPDLADGDDVFEVKIELFYTRDSAPYERIRASRTGKITWNEIFARVGPQLLHETTQANLSHKLNREIEAYFRNNFPRLPKDMDNPKELNIGGSTDQVIVQLLALGLIERGTARRTASDKNQYWKLTSRGEDRLMSARAIRKTRPGTD